MKSRYDVLQDKQQRRRLALLLASPAAALLVASAFLPGCSEPPAMQADARQAASPVPGPKAPASKTPDHIFVSEGVVDYREPLEYMVGQANAQ